MTTAAAAAAAPPGAGDVLADLPGVRAWAEDFYRGLHAHPELSHQEDATGSKVAERLRTAGYEVHVNVSGRVAQPTLDTGIQAMVVAPLAWPGSSAVAQPP